MLLYNRIFKTGSSTTESIIINSSLAMNYGYKIGEINAKSLQKKITKKFSNYDAANISTNNQCENKPNLPNLRAFNN